MVRRLKEDIRVTQGGFPERRVERMVIYGLPADAPELALSRLLDEYRTARERRHASASGKAQAAAGLLVVGLQQRLLSSVEAFARSLAVHRRTVERHWEREQASAAEGEASGGASPKEQSRGAAGEVRGGASASAWPPASEATAPPDDEQQLFLVPPAADDERGEQDAELAEAEEEAQIEAITEAAESGAPDRGAAQAELWRREQALLDRMQAIAERARAALSSVTVRGALKALTVPPKQRPREHDPLALSPRQPSAAVGDHRLEALRQGGHEVRRGGRAQAAPQLLLGRPGSALCRFARMVSGYRCGDPGRRRRPTAASGAAHCCPRARRPPASSAATFDSGDPKIADVPGPGAAAGS